MHASVLSAQGAVHEFTEVHLGMPVRVVLVAPDAVAARTVAERTYARVAELELVFSDWRAGSELRRLELAPTGAWHPVSAPLVEVLALALRVAQATDGAFDPTVGPLTRLWREAARTGVPASDAAVAAARARVGFRQVELDSARGAVRLLRPGVQFDLGAVAKGWILDDVMRGVRAEGISAALVEAGGDLVVHGAPPGAAGWRIGIRDRHGEATIIRTAGAVSTSGPSAQWIRGPDGGRESHVVDVATGRGVRHDDAVTVLGPRAALTDALATALTLVPVGEREALARWFGVRVWSGNDIRIPGH